tara:strand:+ start:3273 stop:4523 length:1251 start_codon:yes stop_codon:yes gene_type:complete
MLIFNSIVFLFTISISALVLPSILPKVSLIGVLLLAFAIILNQSSGLGLSIKSNLGFVKKINYSNSLIPVMGIVLLCALLLSRYLSVTPNLISNATTLLLHLLFLAFIINTKDFLQTYLKAYVLFVFVMSACAIIALLIFSSGSCSDCGHVNISQMTNGSFNRDQYEINSYVFPYNLGFILTGSGKLNLLGVEFYRISGWAHEPTSATLFVVPAILLLIHSKVINNLFIRFFMLITVLLFWIAAMSVGSVLAMMILYSIYIVFNLYFKVFPLRLTLTVVLTVISTLLLIALYFEALQNSSVLTTKFNLEGHSMQTAISELLWFIPDDARYSLYHSDASFYIGQMAIWGIIFLFMWVVLYSLLFQKELNVYALILLYLIIHTMKGSQASVYTHIFAFFWFYMAFYSMLNTHKNSKSG